MFRSRTLFIVGAGASCEVKLPSGAALKAKIADLINIRFNDGWTQSSGDTQITQALRNYVQQRHGSRDINPYLHCAWRIAAAMPQALSIDNYVDAHRGE